MSHANWTSTICRHLKLNNLLCNFMQYRSHRNTGRIFFNADRCPNQVWRTKWRSQCCTKSFHMYMRQHVEQQITKEGLHHLCWRLNQSHNFDVREFPWSFVLDLPYSVSEWDPVEVIVMGWMYCSLKMCCTAWLRIRLMWCERSSQRMEQRWCWRLTQDIFIKSSFVQMTIFETNAYILFFVLSGELKSAVKQICIWSQFASTLCVDWVVSTDRFLSAMLWTISTPKRVKHSNLVTLICFEHLMSCTRPTNGSEFLCSKHEQQLMGPITKRCQWWNSFANWSLWEIVKRGSETHITSQHVHVFCQSFILSSFLVCWSVHDCTEDAQPIFSFSAKWGHNVSQNLNNEKAYCQDLQHWCTCHWFVVG